MTVKTKQLVKHLHAHEIHITEMIFLITEMTFNTIFRLTLHIIL